jgi:hypothetical protein
VTTQAPLLAFQVEEIREHRLKMWRATQETRACKSCRKNFWTSLAKDPKTTHCNRCFYKMGAGPVREGRPSSRAAKQMNEAEVKDLMRAPAHANQ